MFTALGYDVADPRQCQPEYKANFGNVRGKQPVDWAFRVNDSLAFLVEAKAVGKKIDHYDEQLGDYYAKEQGKVKLGILTTGVQWRFFTDLKNENVMDDDPFLKWDVLNDAISEYLCEFLTVLQREKFEPKLITAFARKRRQQSFLVMELTRLLEPSDEFVKLALQNSKEKLSLETHHLTTTVIKQWKPILARALREWAEQQMLAEASGRDALGSEVEEPPHEVEAETDGLGDDAPGHDFRRKFWADLLAFLPTHGHLWADGRKIPEYPWLSTSVGRSGIGVNVCMSKQSRIRVEIYCYHDSEKKLYKKLETHKAEMEQMFSGEQVSWEPLDGKAASRVAVYRSYSKEGVSEDTPARAELFSWIGQQLTKFREVAKKYL